MCVQYSLLDRVGITNNVKFYYTKKKSTKKYDPIYVKTKYKQMGKTNLQ